MRQITLILVIFLFAINKAQAQVGATQTVQFSTTEFNASRIHRWLFGRNWRTEWATPVEVPVVRLDTLLGGLKPYERSGSGESRSLRLRAANGEEWVLRSVSKYRSALLSPLLNNSPYGFLVQDAISMSHPYAALAMPYMMQEADILHTAPRLVYVPKQTALDSFNEDYSENVYLLEERAAGNWSSAAHLGGYNNYLATIEVKEKLRHDNSQKADQHAYIRARLFDVLISDVDRHEGNWRWGVTDTGTRRFVPVPVDRDQAFFKHDGLLSTLSSAITRRRFLQSFGYSVRNVATLGSHDGLLDHYFANEMTAADWDRVAQDLQKALSDDVIRRSVQQLPASVFATSGEEIIRKMQHRRDQLPQLAARFYSALARKVEINGSEGAERFEVQQQADGTVNVAVYRLSAGSLSQPVYQRVFSSAETKRLMIYGFGGSDIFNIGENIRGIRISVMKGINEAQMKEVP